MIMVLYVLNSSNVSMQYMVLAIVMSSGLVKIVTCFRDVIQYGMVM